MTSSFHPESDPARLLSSVQNGESLEQALTQALATENALLTQPELHAQLHPAAEASADETRSSGEGGSEPASTSKMRDVPVGVAIQQRHHDSHGSLEETLLEIYYSNLSLHEAQEILQSLWGDTADLATIRRLCGAVMQRTTNWLERPLLRDYTYVFFDSIQLARRGDGNLKTISLLLAVGVDARGFRDVLGVAAGAAETAPSWSAFLRQLRQRGLTRVKLCVGGYEPDLIRGTARNFPKAVYQCCVTQLLRDVLLLVPSTKEYLVIDSLQRIHASRSRPEARSATTQAVTQLKELGLSEAAALLKRGSERTFNYFALPRHHWQRVNTTETLKKVLRTFRERARVLGCIHDGHTAVQLAGTRLRSIMRTSWGRRRFINVALAARD